MNKIISFLSMQGYGFYVWPAYISVITFLFVQWFRSWRLWKKTNKQ